MEEIINESLSKIISSEFQEIIVEFPDDIELDPKKLIELGFLPYKSIYEVEKMFYGFGCIEFNKLFETLYLSFYLDEENPFDGDFWCGYDINLLFENCRIWCLRTMNFHIKNALTKGNMIPIQLYAPNLLYDSKRIKTDMSMFRLPISTAGNYDGIHVTRYAPSVNDGLYNTGIHDYGTFYYHEPQSTTKLSFNTKRNFKNKYEAYIKLKSEIQSDEPESREIKNFIESDDIVSKYYRDELDIKDDLLYTPQEIIHFVEENNITPLQYPFDAVFPDYEKRKLYVKTFFYSSIRYDSNGNEDQNYEDQNSEDGDFMLYRFFTYDKDVISDVKRYVGVWLGFYAAEDIFDKYLTKFGRILGIDLIIFDKMIGFNGFTTEILDTRPRDISISSLIFLD